MEFKNKKIIIIGASTAGKSTLAKYLREKIQITILEADEELIRLNGGSYPKDNEYKMHVLSPQMVQGVLNRNDIIFFSNTDYFRLQDLKIARQNGFTIIILSLDREEMERRNKNRVINEGYDDLSKYFDDMLNYLKDIENQKLCDAILDTYKPIQDTEKEILVLLKQ